LVSLLVNISWLCGVNCKLTNTPIYIDRKKRKNESYILATSILKYVLYLSNHKSIPILKLPWTFMKLMFDGNSPLCVEILNKIAPLKARVWEPFSYTRTNDRRKFSQRNSHVRTMIISTCRIHVFKGNITRDTSFHKCKNVLRNTIFCFRHFDTIVLRVKSIFGFFKYIIFRFQPF